MARSSTCRFSPSTSSSLGPIQRCSLTFVFSNIGCSRSPSTSTKKSNSSRPSPSASYSRTLSREPTRASRQPVSSRISRASARVSVSPAPRCPPTIVPAAGKKPPLQAAFLHEDAALSVFYKCAQRTNLALGFSLRLQPLEFSRSHLPTLPAPCWSRALASCASWLSCALSSSNPENLRWARRNPSNDTRSFAS